MHLSAGGSVHPEFISTIGSANPEYRKDLRICPTKGFVNPTYVPTSSNYIPPDDVWNLHNSKEVGDLSEVYISRQNFPDIIRF